MSKRSRGLRPRAGDRLEQVLEAYRLLARRGAGVPDRTADAATVAHAARVLRAGAR